MLWIKAFHIISMVCWFSGLFYLPRLFYYHASANDLISQERFKIMEKKLYYYITTPAAFLTIVFGLWLFFNTRSYYQTAMWFHLKISLVILLLGYHHYLGRLRKNLASNKDSHSANFYRYINEIPVFFLFTIVILVVVKPF